LGILKTNWTFYETRLGRETNQVGVYAFTHYRKEIQRRLHMKKILLIAFILLLSVSLFGCANGENEPQQTDEADEQAVQDTVLSFGEKLQTVSLLAPKDVLEKSMKENYGEFVSQELIAKWVSDPSNAPGRLTSSPWPDRIEILEIKKASEASYNVKGEIIEITSIEQAGEGIAAKRPISLVVKKVDDKWIIDDVTLGDYEEEPQPEPLSLKEIFPLSQGSTWQYLGEGNEYASFNRKVLFLEGDRAQVAEDNGGTVSASVFKTTEEEIIRTFFQGEEYDETNLLDQESNDSLVVLKAPLKVGTSWEVPGGVREIVETDAVVDTPAGKFEGCIKVSIKLENSTMYEYFKAGIGMVKREFESEGMKVTSTLEKYEIK
jgi:hypothetical protein